MKFFNRKALIATATTAAVTFGGVSAASAAEATEEGSSADVLFALSSDDNGNVNAGVINDWIKVLTSIVDALDDSFGLADTIFGK